MNTRIQTTSLLAAALGALLLSSTVSARPAEAGSRGQSEGRGESRQSGHDQSGHDQSGRSTQRDDVVGRNGNGNGNRGAARPSGHENGGGQGNAPRGTPGRQGPPPARDASRGDTGGRPPVNADAHRRDENGGGGNARGNDSHRDANDGRSVWNGTRNDGNNTATNGNRADPSHSNGWNAKRAGSNRSSVSTDNRADGNRSGVPIDNRADGNRSGVPTDNRAGSNRSGVPTGNGSDTHRNNAWGGQRPDTNHNNNAWSDARPAPSHSNGWNAKRYPGYRPPVSYRAPHYVNTLPAGYRHYSWNGNPYYNYAGHWYRPYGARYVTVGAPYGLFVSYLPSYYNTFWFGGVRYFNADSTYYTYEPERRGYVVTQSPYGDEETDNSAASDLDEDLYIYPAEGQSEEQQSDDRYECHQWASQETGYDPIDSDYSSAKRADYQRAITACLTGRGYTVR